MSYTRPIHTNTSTSGTLYSSLEGTELSTCQSIIESYYLIYTVFHIWMLQIVPILLISVVYAGTTIQKMEVPNLIVEDLTSTAESVFMTN